MGLDDLAAEGEAEACAGRFGRKKGQQRIPQNLLREAGAAIGDLDDEPLGAGWTLTATVSGGEPDSAAFFNRLIITCSSCPTSKLASRCGSGPSILKGCAAAIRARKAGQATGAGRGCGSLANLA